MCLYEYLQCIHDCLLFSVAVVKYLKAVIQYDAICYVRCCLHLGIYAELSFFVHMHQTDWRTFEVFAVNLISICSCYAFKVLPSIWRKGCTNWSHSYAEWHGVWSLLHYQILYSCCAVFSPEFTGQRTHNIFNISTKHLLHVYHCQQSILVKFNVH